MSALTEGQHTGEFILAMPDPLISMEKKTVTVAAATKLESGHVLAELSATGKFVEYDNVGTDGSEEAAGVLYNECDNTDGEAEADFDANVVLRAAAVRKGDLQWASGMSAGGKTAAYADLAASHIIARD